MTAGWPKSRGIVALWVLMALLAAPLAARADEVADAKRLFGSGTKHFDLAEYEQALLDFKEGYRHKDDPVFLYNIAQCYRLLNKHEEALRFFKTYVRRMPDAPNREEVERKIAALQQAVAAQDRARTVPPTSTLGSSELPPTTESGTPEHPTTTAMASSSAGTSTTLVATAPPPRDKQPIYRKWWLWTGVGAVVAVGLGIGLGVGLSRSSSGTTFPQVQF